LIHQDTRTLRQTKGPKQKKAIKSTLTGPVVVNARTVAPAPVAVAPHAALAAAPEGAPRG
jgi:hypothetical protein